MLSRRRLLTALLLAPLCARATAGRPPQKLAVLDWGLTEILLALGVTPAGVSAPDWYRKLIPTPELPASVLDLGLLFQPNLETLYALRPDAIVITPQHGLLKPALERVAPTLTLPTRGLPGYVSATRQLGERLQRQPQAALLLASLNDKLSRASLLARQVARPVLLAAPVDALHLRVYTAGSLPGDVLAACGLRNGWPGGAGAEGSVLVELTRIADLHARLMLLTPEDQRASVSRWRQSLLWQRLPLTCARNLNLIAENISDAGAVVTAGRFADIFTRMMLRWRNA
ncbi:Ferric hydroxamate ABC transporter [Klebsiella oxytoca]|uniref:ABC transporter substrate-binding protein n=1 Tax=Serratia TaxID=613 RepID=UPI00066E26DC|nr:ABC transporter substrate-binding protein [Serratia marcescens]SAP49357.1 Ferric hydroxamate ABC transporter [Klebsiella oxytoca]AWQ48669.1 ABC transporter substrate-binding protein [Serratia marcescens]BEN40640.1 ABC transporter substrate-binding protein [Serratia marcescens]HEO8932229.1 ABC transporter substrate-binding protein [Serratia marcescens]HEP0988435.1 ABC transporter substrate-binding protein [Serratia marcescens]